MEILKTFRCLADIPITFFSKLLNVTVHTYLAYEQGKMIPPPEIIIMIAMLYDIDASVVIDPSYSIDSTLMTKLNQVAQMNYQEKYKLLSYRILGDNSVPNYRNIRKVKNKIKDSIKQ